MLVGADDSKSVLIARKVSDGKWILYQNTDPASIRAKNLQKIASLASLNEVISHFASQGLKPYFPKAQCIQASDQTHSSPGPSAIKKDRRRYYRKKVELNAEYRNLRTKQVGDALVLDVSFNGLRFTTIGPSDIQVGDRLDISFTLDNPKRSLIKREAQIRHVLKNQAGAEFLNTPDYDKELGFHLWACHGKS